MEEKVTILIVDDEESGREALEGVLFTDAYNLVFAENGKEALEKAVETLPDLILLDVMMPGMDGYEVCRQMRKDVLLAEIPILMLTALDDRESRLTGIEAGADDFISKPYDRIELRARVRTIVRLNRYRHLLLERARFVWVIENDRDAYVILDENGHIYYANQAANGLLKLTPGQNELQPVPFLEKIQQDFSCVPPEAWEKNFDLDGFEGPLYMVSPQTEQRQPLWYEIRLLDLPWITKRQRLLRIQDITELMSLRQETWSFQAAATHKMVTPITNISLSTELIRLLTRDTASEDLTRCLDSLKTDIERLKSEITDILQYINAPKIAPADGLFCFADLEELVRQTADHLAIDDIEVQVATPAVLQACTRFSARAVQITLWELLENAKKFHPSGSPRVSVRLSGSQGGRVTMKIIDDGRWLEPQELAQLLRPYYQLEKEFTGEVAGMGLGLPTVAALVWQAGGEIALHSAPEKAGLVVEISLPVEMPVSPLDLPVGSQAGYGSLR